MKFRDPPIAATCMPFSDAPFGIPFRSIIALRRSAAVLREKRRNACFFFQMRIRATRGRASAAATCPWTVRTAASISARMTAAARTAVIREPRIPTTVHHRTTPRRCRRACTRPSTIPSTNCSWCRVVTSAAITRNPSFPFSSSLFLPPSFYLPGIRRLFLVAFSLFPGCFPLPVLRNDLLRQGSRRSIPFVF